MKQCRRGRGNLIAVAVILLFFVLFTLFAVYLVFFTKDGLSGTYMSQYGSVALNAATGRVSKTI